MTLARKDVAKVAMLARLALSDAEIDTMTGELSKIVGFVSLLEEIDTAGVAPLAHPLDTQNAFRDDVPAASLTTAEALQSEVHTKPDRSTLFKKSISPSFGSFPNCFSESPMNFSLPQA